MTSAVPTTPGQTPAPAQPPASAFNKAWKVDAAGLLLVGVLSLGGYVAGLGPYLGAKVDKARHDMAMDDARRDRDEASANSEKFAKLLASKQEQTKAVEIRLDPFAHRHTRVGAIARLAADTQLMVDQVTPSNPIVINGVAAVVKVPIILSGKGSYVQISAFLRDLHEQFRDTAVESVRLLAEPSTDGAMASFSVTLHWYARPDIAPRADAPS